MGKQPATIAAISPVLTFVVIVAACSALAAESFGVASITLFLTALVDTR